jgi:hypothetical protein
MREIHVYHPDSDFDENDEAVCLCPVTGQNLFTWDEKINSYPSELVYIKHNEIDDPIYIRPDLRDLLAKYYEENNSESYESFEEFFIDQLPLNKEYSKLIVEYPDFIAGDFTIYIYEGVY